MINKQSGCWGDVLYVYHLFCRVHFYLKNKNLNYGNELQKLAINTFKVFHYISLFIDMIKHNLHHSMKVLKYSRECTVRHPFYAHALCLEIQCLNELIAFSSVYEKFESI